jgi:hypothetical protein
MSSSETRRVGKLETAAAQSSCLGAANGLLRWVDLVQ